MGISSGLRRQRMKIWTSLLLLLVVGVTVIRSDVEVDDDDDDDVDVEVEDDNEIKPEKPKFKPPKVKGSVNLAESFNKKSDFNRWVLSQAKKDGAEEDVAKYDGKWSVEEPKSSAVEGDLGLILKSKAKHHAVSRKLDRPFEFKGKPLLVQYEVRYQSGIDCGGAYVKLLSAGAKTDLKNFHDKTPYTIMFGPDKCGMDHKLHFIFRHKNPKTGEIEEKHAKKPTASIDSHFSDKKTHLYTLVVNPDNSYEMLIDNTVVSDGSLLKDVSPPVNPPAEIDDPKDKKPEDWDEREKIPDPDATKPDDWDESQPQMIVDPDAVKPDGWLDKEEKLIPDPDAEKPKDWDDDMDGEWEAPLVDNPKCTSAPGCGKWEQPEIKNPKYKGKWHPEMIDNPDYKGVWKPRRIANPDFFEDLDPYRMTPIDALGLELWSMNDDIVFDNFLITDDRSVAELWASETFEIKSTAEKAEEYAKGRSVIDAIKDATKDKPWLWAVILVVVVLPIVLIIAYCCMSGKSERGLLSSMMTAAEEYPWLWAIYAILMILPILLLCICLCPQSDSKSDSLEQKKKTDSVSPDDTQNEEGEGEGDGETGKEGESQPDAGGDNQTKKPSKSSLNAEEAGLQESQSTGEEGDEEEEESKESEETPTRYRATYNTLL
ncbi:hypothetical protein FSP39_007002 [Pinctada imbricata]|uniref:Calnexin n=1 Tax=Pinctada imbricata TaxID=66713 RepID=A0AA88YHQ3_PINIB|nr:hypothetical protein FSP39_007002 [Pinctada imbricata]